MALVLFDFDGTITKRDTLFPFLLHTCGGIRFFAGVSLLTSLPAAYALKIVSAEYAKSWLLSFFLKGQAREEIEAAGAAFCAHRLPSLLREDMIGLLKSHVSQGNEVCVVSASCDAWLKPFCAEYKTHRISTEL